MFGSYCVAFIEYTLPEENLDNTNLFSPNDYKSNDKMIYKYFKHKHDVNKT